MSCLRTALIGGLALGALAGCGGPVSRTAGTAASAAGSVAGAAVTAVNPATYARAIAQSTGQVVGYVADTTSATRTRGGGSQIEYLAADGEAYRVRPGSDTVETGQWGARETAGQGSGTQICSRYPGRGQPDVWQCIDTVQWVIDHAELRPGDPMDLENSAQVPQKLPANTEVSVGEAAALWDKSVTLGADKAPW